MTTTATPVTSAEAEDTEGSTTVTRSGFRLVARFMRSHPMPTVVSVLGAVAFAAAAVGFTIVIGRVTDSVITPAFTSKGVTRPAVIGAVVTVMLAGAARGASVVVRRYFAAMWEARMQVTLRTAVLDKYLSLPMSFFRERPTGELLAHTDADVSGTTMLIKPLPFSIGLITLVVFAVINLVLVDWTFALVAILLFPALTVINRIYTAKVEVPSANVQQRMGDLAAVAHESFDGALVVKTLGLEAQETQRFSDAAMRLRAERLVVGRLRAGFEPLLDALPALGTLLLLVVGAWRISTHDVTAGEVIQAATLFALLAFPMRVFGFFLEELPRAVSSVSRVDNVIAHADAADGPNFDEVGVVSTAGRPAGRAASLAFRNVSFGYGAASVLEDVSFHVEPGEVVALVGSTGSGKSTINELALRLLEPTNGSIEINGVELSSMMREEIAQQIALVFQESFLFAATLRENVMLGATLADHEAVEELSRVSELARIDHFLDVLSNGWESPLGERGVSLSGGQRQRVALARALMRRPSLLLLDDATSALDPEVESQILRGLATLETTVLIVAHRLSTITLADRVLFLDGGRIAESGTHQSLLANPRYAALVHAYERSSEGVEVEP